MIVRYQVKRTGSGEVDENAVRKAVYGIADWKSATEKQAIATLHNDLGEMKLRGEFLGVAGEGETAELHPRAFVNTRIRDDLNRETERWGIHIKEIYLRIVGMHEGIIRSLFEEGTAKRKATVARIEAEGVRDAALRKVEAEAGKISILSEAIKARLTSQDFIALRYIEAIEKMAADPSTKVLLPYDIFRTLGEVTRTIEGGGTPPPKPTLEMSSEEGAGSAPDSRGPVSDKEPKSATEG
jgi:regulator of protease activity HflC (stomatin/prohibitin superfamily)